MFGWLQVLMRTRSSDARERRRAVALLAGIASRLAEDYLLLLPEALPFLAELLEDPDPPTQAKSRPRHVDDASPHCEYSACDPLAPTGTLRPVDGCAGGRTGVGSATAGVVRRVAAGAVPINQDTAEHAFVLASARCAKAQFACKARTLLQPCVPTLWCQDGC